WGGWWGAGEKQRRRQKSWKVSALAYVVYEASIKWTVEDIFARTHTLGVVPPPHYYYVDC
ncbi:MAG: hypothetical protein ACK55Z_15940, partial [bacterium]